MEVWVGLPVGTGNWQSVRATASAAERDGFHGVWVGDHLDFPPGAAPLESWTVLSAVAGVTARVRLATVTLSVPLRHPAVLAKAATALQHVSGGRLSVLLGAGADAREHHAYGVPFPSFARRVEQVADALRVCRRLTSSDGRPVDYAGPTVRLAGAVNRPAPPASLLLGVGGTGPRLRALAVELADELCIGLEADPAPVLAALADDERAAGRRVRRSVLAPCTAPGARPGALSDHPRDLARADVEEQVAAYRRDGVDAVYAVLTGPGSYRALRDRLEVLGAG